jgi:hypothetical protein
MVYFKTKNTDLGKFWRAYDWEMLVYFTAMWSNLIYVSCFGMLPTCSKQPSELRRIPPPSVSWGRASTTAPPRNRPEAENGGTASLPAQPENPRLTGLEQGCQMVIFKPKIPIWVNFGRP